MTRIVRILTLLVTVGGVAACGDALGPAADLTVFVSVSPDRVLLGDTAEFVGVVHNGGDVTLDVARSWAPGIRFLVTDSAGTETDLYEGLAFPCPRLDSHDIEAGETDVVRWTWVPEALGVNEEDIPADVVEAEKKHAKQEAIDSGKPEEIAEKMVIGKMRKYLDSVVLLRQPFVKDDKQQIQQILPKGVTIKAFKKIAIG